MPVNTERIEYARMIAKWEKCRDVVSGEDRVKERGELYLPKLGRSQKPEAYDAYKMRGMFYGATSRTIDALVGMVFRKDPVVNAPARLDPLLKDISLNNIPLNSFGILSLQEMLTVGRYGILIDFQGNGVPKPERRPYFVAYQTEAIINWHEEKIHGDVQLQWIILRERGEEAQPDYTHRLVTRWRVLELVEGVYTSTLWQKKRSDVSGEEIEQFEVIERIVPTRLGETIDFIPFVVWGPTTLGPEPIDPPSLDLANVNLSLYRTETDLEHGAHWTALPTPVLIGAQFPAGAGPMSIGAGTTIELPTGGDAKMLEFTGAGLGALEKRAQAKIDRMAVLGARLIEDANVSRGNETIIGAQSRQTANHAVLKTITKTTSEALTRALQISAWWMGATQEVNDAKISIELNLAFDGNKITSDELKTYLVAVQSGQMSFEWFYHLMQQGELTIPKRTWEEEQDAIKRDAPEPALGMPGEPGGPPVPGQPPPPKPGEKAPKPGADEDDEEDAPPKAAAKGKK